MGLSVKRKLENKLIVGFCLSTFSEIKRGSARTKARESPLLRFNQELNGAIQELHYDHGQIHGTFVKFLNQPKHGKRIEQHKDQPSSVPNNDARRMEKQL